MFESHAIIRRDPHQYDPAAGLCKFNRLRNRIAAPSGFDGDINFAATDWFRTELFREFHAPWMRIGHVNLIGSRQFCPAFRQERNRQQLAQHR